MPGIGDSWGTEEELLHPRGPDGRWIRKSISKVLVAAILGIMGAFRPRSFQSDAQASQYLSNAAGRRPGRFGGGRGYARLSADYGAANEDLRDGIIDEPSTKKFVQMMDDSAVELQDDVILSRVVGIDAFGFTPQTVQGTGDTDPGIRGMAGEVVADRGYSLTNIGTPLGNKPQGAITMVIAARGTKPGKPGTKAIIPARGGNDRSVYLDRGQQYYISKVEPDGRGGWNMYAVAVSDEEAGGEIPAPQAGPIGLGREGVDREARVKASEDRLNKAGRIEGDALVEQQDAQRPVAAEQEQARLRAEQQERVRKAMAREAGGTPAPVTQPQQQQPQQPAAPGAPPPRNEPILARSVGTSPPVGRVPEAPAPAAGAPAVPEAPAVPRRTVDLRLAVRDANIPAPAAGNNRKRFNDAYEGIISGKKDPIDATRELDRDAADLKAAGDQDADNLQQLSDLIKREYGLEAPTPAKKAAPAKAAPAVPRTAAGLPKQEGLTPVKKAAPRPRAAPEPDLNVTIPNLRKIAQDEGVDLPKRALKADIQQAIRAKRAGTSGGAPAAPSAAPAKKAVPAPVAKAVPTRPMEVVSVEPATAGDLDKAALDKMTKDELLAEALRKNVHAPKSWTKDKIKAALRGETPAPAAKKTTPARAPLPKAPVESQGEDLDRMLKADLLRVAEAEGVPATARMNKTDIKDMIRDARGGGAAKKVAAPVKAVPDADDPEERVKALFRGRRPSNTELLNFARNNGLQVDPKDSRREMILGILGQATPRRGLGVSPSLAVPAKKAVPSTSVPGGAVPGQRSIAPEIPNRWGALGTGGEVEFHADGVIGQGLQNMGDDRLMDVDGEPLSNIVGRMATRAVRGDTTQAQLLDELRRLEARLPEGSKARRGIARMIKDIDAPERKVDIPDSAPAPLRKLMERLLKIPVARTAVDRPGFHRSQEDSEVDGLQKILQEIDAGRSPNSLRLDQDLRGLQNHIHESQEGKFEVDRAIGDAIGELGESRTAQKAVPAPPAPTPAKAAVPGAAPGTAAGKITAGRLTVGDRILVTQAPDGTWIPSTRKTGQTTLEIERIDRVAVQSGRRSGTRLVMVGKDADGNEVRVKAGIYGLSRDGVPPHQTFIVAPEAGAPAKKAVPAAPDLERRARDRQTDLFESKKFADVAAELDELIDSDPSDRALLSRFDAAANREEIADELDPVRAHLAVGRRVEAQREMARILQGNGVTANESAGDVAPWDPKVHQDIGASALREGDMVRVVRPGHRVLHDGEDVQLSKAIVERASPEEVRAREVGQRLVPTDSVPGPRAQTPVDNAPRKRELREAWIRAEITPPEGESKDRLKEIQKRLLDGDITPEESIRMLENEVAFDKEARTGLEAELRRADLEDRDRRDIQRQIAELEGGIEAQEKASTFLRLYFRDEQPSPAEIKMELPKESVSVIEQATPDDMQEVAKGAGLEKLKGDTAQEMFDDLVKQLAAKALAKKAPKKGTKRAKAAAPRVPSEPGKVDARLVAQGLDLDDRTLAGVQEDLDAGDKTPAQVGRELELQAQGVRSQAAVLYGRGYTRPAGEGTDVEALKQAEYTRADNLQALAERLKTTRRPAKKTSPLMAPGKAVTARVGPDPLDDLKTRLINDTLEKLGTAPTRESGEAALGKLTLGELRRLADQSGVQGSNKQELKDNILDRFIGDRGDLGRLDDDQLADLFRDVTTADSLDEVALKSIDEEFKRREIERLMNNGLSYQEAYAEVHNLDPKEMERKDLASAVDAQKTEGRTRDQVVRQLYHEHVYESYLRAEQWTNGNIRNRAGAAAGVDPLSLFSGPRTRARKYATEELARFWEEVEPRLTFTEFRALALGRVEDKRQAKKIRGQGQERDFGL